jgi:transcription elongation factor GreA
MRSIRVLLSLFNFVRWGPFNIPHLAARSRSPSATSLRRSLAAAGGISVTITIVKAKLLKKFEDEIQQLDKELKTELPREIKRARELGDLRENAEYQAAKERQRLVESRISMLQMRVSQIQLMNLEKIPHGKVGFGSTVTLHDPAGQIIVYTLVMPEDANVDEGLISTASPIGRALLNKEEGDEIVVKRPDGTERQFELVKLVTIHDA